MRGMQDQVKEVLSQTLRLNYESDGVPLGSWGLGGKTGADMLIQ